VPFTPTSSKNQWWTFETGTNLGTGETEQMITDGSTSYLDGKRSLCHQDLPKRFHLLLRTHETKMAASVVIFLTAALRRIQIPYSQGIWPAFWMLGDNGVIWPGCGEIDIMENNRC
jgi:Glycosyl hydrolases family 16